MLDRRRAARAVLAAALLAIAACAPKAPAPEAVVNVYSSRHYDVDAALFRAFENETGIRVRAIEAPGDQLLARLQSEGPSSPADLILTVDAGALWRLAEAGLFQPAQSPALEAAVPARLRDPQGRWYALSKRARVLVYAPDRLNPSQIASLDALAAPELKGRVCARSSTNTYSLSLMATRIERLGAAAATEWAAGIVRNFARDPQGSDTDQIRAVAAGICDVALVNHYYLVRMSSAADPADREIAAKLALVFPDQDGAGAHINVSGGGVAAHAPHPENAVRLLEFLLSPQAQAEIARMNDEYPIRADVALPQALAGLGPFREEEAPLAAYGARQAEAQAAFDEAGWR